MRAKNGRGGCTASFRFFSDPARAAAESALSAAFAHALPPPPNPTPPSFCCALTPPPPPPPALPLVCLSFPSLHSLWYAVPTPLLQGLGFSTEKREDGEKFQMDGDLTFANLKVGFLPLEASRFGAFLFFGNKGRWLCRDHCFKLRLFIDHCSASLFPGTVIRMEVWMSLRRGSPPTCSLLLLRGDRRRKERVPCLVYGLFLCLVCRLSPLTLYPGRPRRSLSPRRFRSL